MERLFFFNNRTERKNHLSYYNEIDVSLDTFPLTGGTTTCEALWMGVPVVSLVGPAFHQRISYSALMHCGLEELCTFDDATFVDRAVEIAKKNISDQFATNGIGPERLFFFKANPPRCKCLGSVIHLHVG